MFAGKNSARHGYIPLSFLTPFLDFRPRSPLPRPSHFNYFNEECWMRGREQGRGGRHATCRKCLKCLGRQLRCRHFDGTRLPRAPGHPSTHLPIHPSTLTYIVARSNPLHSHMHRILCCILSSARVEVFSFFLFFSFFGLSARFLRVVDT